MTSKDPLETQPRERENQWLLENKAWLEEKHAGEWVALEGDQLLAAGPDLKTVLAEARAKGVEVPFIDAVRAKKYQGVMMFRRWN